MNIMKTKFIVVSLPRTGTMSMTQMMKDLGFDVLHVPGPDYQALLERHEFLADTPMFASFVIKEVLSSSDEVKFIYIEKSPEEWVKSMIKVGLDNAYNGMYTQIQNGETLSHHLEIDYKSLQDVLTTEFTEENAIDSFHNHRKIVENLIPADRLLKYNFSDGWKPLCDFIGKETPSIKTPHLNVDTMFDKIV